MYYDIIDMECAWSHGTSLAVHSGVFYRPIPTLSNIIILLKSLIVAHCNFITDAKASLIRFVGVVEVFVNIFPLCV